MVCRLSEPVTWRLETGDFIAAQYVTLSEIQYEQGIISFLSKQVSSPETSSSSLQSPAYKEAGLFPAPIIGQERDNILCSDTQLDFPSAA